MKILFSRISILLVLSILVCAISVGQVLNLQTNKGQVQVTVLKVGRFNVDVDGNHPLAGQQLTFDVEITDVRDATEEETKHRHVHGPGGHQHD